MTSSASADFGAGMHAAARILGLVAVLFGWLTLNGGPAGANGWQWHSIPREALISGLTSGYPANRAFAVRALGFRRDREVVATLVDMLADPAQPPEVRIEVVRALGRIGDPAAGAALAGLLDGDDDMAAEAADALGDLAAPGTLPALIAALESGASLFVKTRVAAALGHFPDPASVAVLADILRVGRNKTLRRQAVRALGQTAMPEAAGPLIEALAAARGDRVRTEIVDALGRTKAAAARAPLTELLSEATDPWLKVRITIALGAIEDGSAAPALIRLLDDPSPPVRYHAVRGLGQVDDRRGIAPLRRLYDEVARKNAALTWTDMTRDPVAYLADLSLRYEAVRALHEIDAPAALEVFLDAAKPRDLPRDSTIGLRLNEGLYQLRRAAIVALGYTKSEEVAAWLAENALADRDFRIRAAAVRALGVLGAPGAAIRLIPLLEDSKPEVRWEAATVVGRLGDGAVTAKLTDRLYDSHPEVRRQAALSLGYLRAAASRARLEGLARDDGDERVREAARDSLRLLAGK